MRLIKVLLAVLLLLFIGIVVYESREAVQKKQADNTLKQLGMALQNYHSTHSVPTWDGHDEASPAQGRGGAILDGNEIKGMILIHHGDESEFKAEKKTKREW